MGHKKDLALNYCTWCGAPTIMERMQLAESPILEFMEQKINKLGRKRVWSRDANWSELDLDSDDEAELLVYDEMLNSVSLKHVCESCIMMDDELFKKYYGNENDEIIFDADI